MGGVVALQPPGQPCTGKSGHIGGDALVDQAEGRRYQQHALRHAKAARQIAMQPRRQKCHTGNRREGGQRNLKGVPCMISAGL